MILIITNKEDAHPSPVIDILNNCGVSVFRLNTEALLSDYEFGWFNESGETDFWIKNIRNNLEISGSKIISIWERRPEFPKELPIQSTTEINNHNLKEAGGFLSFLRFYLKDIFSIGSIVNDRTASSKMLQLKIANDIGLKTPNTCFSNKKEDILKFSSQHEYVILKSIENDFIWDESEGLEYVFYAQKIKASALLEMDEESFSQTVSYVQNYIEKAYELRITMVGEKVFACKIDSQILDDDKGKVDWRQGYDYGLKYEIYDLPRDISDKCFQFLIKLGLNFGCFDFIVTPDGDYVFLECNSNGQWLWIENETGMKISEAIADALMRNK